MSVEQSDNEYVRSLDKLFKHMYSEFHLFMSRGYDNLHYSLYWKQKYGLYRGHPFFDKSLINQFSWAMDNYFSEQDIVYFIDVFGEKHAQVLFACIEPYKDRYPAVFSKMVCSKKYMEQIIDFDIPDDVLTSFVKCNRMGNAMGVYFSQQQLTALRPYMTFDLKCFVDAREKCN